MKLTKKAKQIYDNKLEIETENIKKTRLISSYSYATTEENASGGVIVTAPTCGACGVLPAVLYYMKNDFSMAFCIAFQTEYKYSVIFSLPSYKQT